MVDDLNVPWWDIADFHVWPMPDEHGQPVRVGIELDAVPGGPRFPAKLTTEQASQLLGELPRNRGHAARSRRGERVKHGAACSVSPSVSLARRLVASRVVVASARET
jgi:hypothetical protein